MASPFGPRRAVYVDIAGERPADPLSPAEAGAFEALDLVYRSLCALMFNYVPTSGHPGGSISSGRFVAALLYDTIDVDLAHPDREDADIVSYAAGHKALGLYAMWALRNEIARIAAPELLPPDPRWQLRLEDLLGFRRNPVTATPLFRELHAKPLDGHPTPATPFVRLSTGASGVGMASSLGLAYAARDVFGGGAPRVHIVEGEGGLTPGRVAEALAAAGTAGLDNAFVHLDWNQASIDSNRVCREGSEPGDYVQWTPAELFHLHDWNVVFVPDGKDLQQVFAAQRIAMELHNGQPTAIVYRTIKGWRYGVEGRASHGAGHKLCSDGFYEALAPLANVADVHLPSCDAASPRCAGDNGSATMEQCFHDALGVVRAALAGHPATTAALARRLVASRDRLDRRALAPREGAPRVEAVYELAGQNCDVPDDLALAPGTSTTLRGELGRVLGYFNTVSGGALVAAAADLLGSTSINAAAAGFPAGFWHAERNPGARLLSIGGICEDAMSGILGGLSTFGHHVGVGSSYGAFLAPLGHIAARLHAIGAQARHALVPGAPYHPLVLVCAHAGLKTGEDGPTHADPQALQLFSENFPKGLAITLTPWDPAEVWPLVCAAFARRPALIAPFVTRPNETVPDRAALGLAPARDAARGVYRLRAAQGRGDGAIVLQESGVTMAFVQDALPRLIADGIDLDLYYVASAELFDLSSTEEQERSFPGAHADTAMGITGFTLPTMYRWIRSDRGRRHTLHPFGRGHYLGSGQADKVLEEAGLDGESQYRAVKAWLDRK